MVAGLVDLRLAELGETNARDTLIYAAKRNRNLHVITSDEHDFDFTKSEKGRGDGVLHVPHPTDVVGRHMQ